MDILHVINMWLIKLEHHNNLNAVVTRINIPQNPVLSVEANQVWEFNIIFSNLYSYNKIKYEYLDRRYTKYGWGNNTHLVKHKYG